MDLRLGKADVNVLDRSVYRRLGRTFSPEEKETIVSAAGAGADTGFLSVIAAANDLAAAGLRPETAQTAVLLPEGSREEQLRGLEDGIREAAERTGLLLTGGHTEVTRAAAEVLVITAAQGSRREETGRSEETAAGSAGEGSGHKGTPGAWHIVAAGAVGMEGTCRIAAEKKAELGRRFPIRFVEETLQLREQLYLGPAAQAAEAVPHLAGTAASGGGIYAALWNFAGRTGRALGLPGFDVDLLAIPIRQETVEICDYYDINPYQLAAGGSMLAAVPEQEAGRLVALLRVRGILAADIGSLHTGRERRLHNKEEVRFLDRPAPDALFEIPGLG